MGYLLETGAYWNRGLMKKRHTVGTTYVKGALIGRKTLDRFLVTLTIMCVCTRVILKELALS